MFVCFCPSADGLQCLLRVSQKERESEYRGQGSVSALRLLVARVRRGQGRSPLSPSPVHGYVSSIRANGLVSGCRHGDTLLTKSVRGIQSGCSLLLDRLAADAPTSDGSDRSKRRSPPGGGRHTDNAAEKVCINDRNVVHFSDD